MTEAHSLKQNDRERLKMPGRKESGIEKRGVLNIIDHPSNDFCKSYLITEAKLMTLFVILFRYVKKIIKTIIFLKGEGK